MDTLRIPDQHHIEEIRKRLWSGREIGKAAVMVGAGFSRNARPINPTAPTPPLLENIAEELFETLYPANSMPESERLRLKARMTVSTAIMNLASEFEIVFGRQALDDVLIGSVADDKHVPGEIHELLLALPWSDVFTTNYDKLIERTRPRIHNRKYELSERFGMHLNNPSRLRFKNWEESWATPLVRHRDTVSRGSSRVYTRRL